MIQDFVALGIEDAVAAHGREGSGDIMFSTDFVWALERLSDENCAKFMSRLTLWHELGHAIWLSFRGNRTGSSQQMFKGANSKKPTEAEVISSQCILNISPSPAIPSPEDCLHTEHLPSIRFLTSMIVCPIHS